MSRTLIASNHEWQHGRDQTMALKKLKHKSVQFTPPMPKRRMVKDSRYNDLLKIINTR